MRLVKEIRSDCIKATGEEVVYYLLAIYKIDLLTHGVESEQGQQEATYEVNLFINQPSRKKEDREK